MKKLWLIIITLIVSSILSVCGAYNAPPSGWIKFFSYVAVWGNGFAIHQLISLYRFRKDTDEWTEICEKYHAVSMYWMSEALGKEFNIPTVKKEDEQPKYH